MTHASPPVRFAVIGLDHAHIYGMTNALLRGGAELVAFAAPDPRQAAGFARAFPQAGEPVEQRAILEDETIHLVACAGIPNERAPLGIEVMRAGKDFVVDKPGITDLDQLAEVRRVQQETRRIYSICYSERLESRATVRAGELVRAGAIGRVVQTIGLGPHRIGLHSRPKWFFQRERYGGILTDIASHQVDQFLFFTGAKDARVVSSSVANYAHPEHPELEDFGEMTLRGDGAHAFIRVDWYTPDGLGTWGDVRLTILGTAGFIELRKNCDLGGRPGGEHLFLVDGEDTRRLDCTHGALPYGGQLVRDVIDRTETAMAQEHCFLATELALRAEAQAERLGHLR